MDARTVRDWLAKLREQRGVGQVEFARQIGVSQSTVSKIEDFTKDYDPGLDVLTRIASALMYSDVIAFLQAVQQDLSLPVIPVRDKTPSAPNSTVGLGGAHEPDRSVSSPDADALAILKTLVSQLAKAIAAADIALNERRDDRAGERDSSSGAA